VGRRGGRGEHRCLNALKQNGAPDVAGGVEFLTGSGTLTGADTIDIMLGESGMTTSGNGGDDVLLGGDGNDLRRGPGRDRRRGAERPPLRRSGRRPGLGVPGERCRYRVQPVNYTIGVNVENLALTGTATSGRRNASTTSAAIQGATRWSADGDDVMFGNEGNDYLEAGPA
jgi:Ca2+-binding RTX toxin-like protein